MGVSDTKISEPTLVGKKNIYICPSCGHGFVTVDKDDGTTPFMTDCQRPGCGKAAHSLFYRCPQDMLADVQPALEWYRPTVLELGDKPPHVLDHIAKGGLLHRPPTKSYVARRMRT